MTEMDLLIYLSGHAARTGLDGPWWRLRENEEDHLSLSLYTFPQCETALCAPLAPPRGVDESTSSRITNPSPSTSSPPEGALSTEYKTFVATAAEETKDTDSFFDVLLKPVAAQRRAVGQPNRGAPTVPKVAELRDDLTEMKDEVEDVSTAVVSKNLPQLAGSISRLLRRVAGVALASGVVSRLPGALGETHAANMASIEASLESARCLVAEYENRGVEADVCALPDGKFLVERDPDYGFILDEPERSMHVSCEMADYIPPTIEADPLSLKYKIPQARTADAEMLVWDWGHGFLKPVYSRTNKTALTAKLPLDGGVEHSHDFTDPEFCAWTLRELRRENVDFLGVSPPNLSKWTPKQGGESARQHFKKKMRNHMALAARQQYTDGKFSWIYLRQNHLRPEETEFRRLLKMDGVEAISFSTCAKGHRAILDDRDYRRNQPFWFHRHDNPLITNSSGIAVRVRQKTACPGEVPGEHLHCGEKGVVLQKGRQMDRELASRAMPGGLCWEIINGILDFWNGTRPPGPLSVQVARKKPGSANKEGKLAMKGKKTQKKIKAPAAKTAAKRSAPATASSSPTPATTTVKKKSTYIRPIPLAIPGYRKALFSCPLDDVECRRCRAHRLGHGKNTSHTMKRGCIRYEVLAKLYAKKGKGLPEKGEPPPQGLDSVPGPAASQPLAEQRSAPASSSSSAPEEVLGEMGASPREQRFVEPKVVSGRTLHAEDDIPEGLLPRPLGDDVDVGNLTDLTELKEILSDLRLDLEMRRPERDPEEERIDEAIPWRRPRPPPSPGAKPPPAKRGMFTKEYMEKAIARLKDLPSLSTGPATRKEELRRIHEEMGCPEYASWEAMLMGTGATTEDLQTAMDLCKESEPLHLERAPPNRPVAAAPRAVKFNEHVNCDLWYTPEGGNSDYILHLCDSVIEVSVLVCLDSKDSDNIVNNMEDKWIRRFQNAPHSWGFDADSVFNSRTMLYFCGSYGTELRTGPGGAHWSRGKMERRNMTLGYLWRRLARLRPHATKEDLAFACEMAINGYTIKDGLSSFQHLYGDNMHRPSLFTEDDCQLTGGDEGTRRELQRLATMLIHLADVDSCKPPSSWYICQTG